jgi:hypothetical protein
MRTIFRVVGTGVFAAAAMFAGNSSARAAAVTPVVSGQSYNGWQITIGSSDVSLIKDPSGASSLSLEKAATITPSDVSGLAITFTKTGGSAASSIVIDDEAITNHTGVALTGFEFLLTGTSSAFVSSLTSPFAPPTGYTSFVFSPTSIIYSGTQANGATSDWGFDADGDLVINPGTDSSFTFTEIPIGSGGPFGPPGVPLPAAAWQGLVGLLALGAIRYGKSAIKLFA